MSVEDKPEIAESEAENVEETTGSEPETLGATAGPETEAVVEDSASEAEAVVEDAAPEAEDVVEDAASEAEDVVEDAASEAEAVAEDAGPEAEAVVEDAAPGQEGAGETAGPVADAVAETTESELEDEDEDTEADESELTLRPVPDDGIERRWYALHAHSGQEINVRDMLLQGAELQNVGELVTNVFVPMENIEELRAGEKKMTSRKFFPGYVLVQLPVHPEKYADLWHFIKETPGVTGFIGSRSVPVPLEDAEVEAIVEVIRGEREQPRAKVAFDCGELVKIIDGPFANFLGKVDEINADRGSLKVQVEIFERLTNVEVEFWQVEKV